jgi:hypothetical protein
MSTQLFDKLVYSLYCDLNEKFPLPFSYEETQGPVGLKRVLELDLSGIKNPDEYRAHAQFVAIFKKYIGDSSYAPFITNEDRKVAAISKFTSANERCGVLNRELFNSCGHPQDVLESPPYFAQLTKSEKERYLLNPPYVETFMLDADVRELVYGMKRIIHDAFENSGVSADFIYLRDLTELRPGPGASRGIQECDFYTKVGDSHHTFSDPVLQSLYQLLICSTPNGLENEFQRAVKYGKKDRVCNSALTTVPKSIAIDRIVCTEPLLNMFLQLAYGRLLCAVLVGLGIDLQAQQELNRIYAMAGSAPDLEHAWMLVRDAELTNWGSTVMSYDYLLGGKCTIDLVGASDHICCGLVRNSFPPVHYEFMSLIRSSFTTIDDKPYKLEMFSTMGNGFTFPLQTLLFTSIVKYCYEEANVEDHTVEFTVINGILKQRRHNKFCVYGDDIIVDRNVYDGVEWALTVLGFICNSKKSFKDGRFRESCGHDWHSGLPVRPVYIENLSTKQDRVSAINRLIRWSSCAGIFLPRTIGLLSKTIANKSFVPPYEDDNAGIHISFDVAKQLPAVQILQTPALRKLTGASEGCVIYKKDVAREMTRSFWSIKSTTLESSVETYVKPKTLAWIVDSRGFIDPYYELTFPSRKVQTFSNHDRGFKNWPTILDAVLGGYIRGTTITLRNRDVMYKTDVFDFTPGWHDSFDACRFSGWTSAGHLWKDACTWYYEKVFCHDIDVVTKHSAHKTKKQKHKRASNQKL